MRIAVTGSECTGKTTLAHKLAKYYCTQCSDEGARTYLNQVGRILRPSDIQPIAHNQINIEDKLIQSGHDIVILDTDLFSTAIYSQLYFDFCPEWILGKARKRKADLYLLCDIDLPWIPDGIQRDRGTIEEREITHKAFMQELGRSHCAIAPIRGRNDERLQNAVTVIEQMRGTQ